MDRNTAERKQAVAQQILHNQWLTVQFRVSDPRVRVPPSLLRSYKNDTMALEFGRDMPVPIPDLLLTAFGISGTLVFSGKPYWCCVPWIAVYALIGKDGNGAAWEEDFPESIRQHKAAHARRTQLRLVQGGALLSKPAIGVLRLVKDDPDLHRTEGTCSTCEYTTDPADPLDVLKHGYCTRCWTS